MIVAITREVSPSFDRCELTHRRREPIDLELAREQHGQYEACLESLGCTITRLPAEPGLPDSVFVEDTAIVLDDIAIVTRPGAESRRPETSSIARALEPYRRLAFIQAPATLDGGDVVRVAKTLYVGLSTRSGLDAIEQLRALLAPGGYTIVAVPVTGCLHLKSAATRVAENTLLVNREWVDTSKFADLELLDVDPSEPDAANALRVGDTLIYSSAYPRTAKRLRKTGLEIREVDASECGKAEGGVTCGSLIFRP